MERFWRKYIQIKTIAQKSKVSTNVYVLKPRFFWNFNQIMSMFSLIIFSNLKCTFFSRHGARIPNDDDVVNLQVTLLNAHTHIDRHISFDLAIKFGAIYMLFVG